VTAAHVEAYLFVPDILECLGHPAGASGSHREAVRLFGAAHQARHQMGSVRFKVFDPVVEVWIAGLRDAMDRKDFDAAWSEGAERPPLSSTLSGSSQKAFPTKTSQPGFSHRRERCSPTFATSTASSV
jgi:hypothetical protein